MSKKLNYGKLGFTEYQLNDFNIVMSLKTTEQIHDWMESVGYEDVCYGITLVELAAHTLLDQETDAMTEFPEAMSVISKFMH
jgi:hypothetical protein